ncbi:MAG: sulfatase, partial [Thermoanaerobaculia bacterium]|nr:sulfatase [Thermoanaerobaculia bacterium]
MHPSPPFFRAFVSRTAPVLAIALLWLGCGDRDARPKNLLILSVDTLRADAIGAAGYQAARTPNIDRLAAEGTYFTTALAPMPRTTPALGSLLTGLWPQRHGSREVGDPIREEVATLAEIFSQRGFATLAVSANDTAGPKQGLDRGFERFVTYRDLIASHGDHLYRDLTDIPPDNPGWATVVTDQALALLRATPPEQPFLLWTFFFDPHFLYRPPRPWQDQVEAGRCWELYGYFQEHRQESGQVFSDVGGVATRALEDCRRLYDVEIAYTDAEIGRLLAALAEMGRLEETLVVFVADHGENFGESGLFFEHGDNVHDAGLRVPLIWKGPGMAPGRRDPGVVSLVDVMPTLLEVFGVPGDQRPTSDGVDLAPRLWSRAPPPPHPA